MLLGCIVYSDYKDMVIVIIQIQHDYVHRAYFCVVIFKVTLLHLYYYHHKAIRMSTNALIGDGIDEILRNSANTKVTRNDALDELGMVSKVLYKSILYVFYCNAAIMHIPYSPPISILCYGVSSRPVPADWPQDHQRCGSRCYPDPPSSLGDE